MINQTLYKVHRNSMHHLISSYFGGQSTHNFVTVESIYYLLTESEVITGKYQTNALTY